MKQGLMVFFVGVRSGAILLADEWNGLGAAAGVFPACSGDEFVEGLVKLSVLVCTEVGDGCV